MKNRIGLLLIGFGIYIVLFSGWKIVRGDYVDKNRIVKCEENDFIKQNGTDIFDKQACVSRIESKVYKTKTKFSYVLILGFGLLLAGLVVNWKRLKKKISDWLIHKLVMVKIIEVFINISYWLLVGLIYFQMRFIAKGKVDSCTIDCMFIFYIAGFVGFYAAYLFLTDKYLKFKKIGAWIIGALFSAVIGALLAYFVPFYLNDLSKLSFSMFINGAFLQGFFLMTFFIIANIVVGTIFKGFFNWIEIIYQKIE